MFLMKLLRRKQEVKKQVQEQQAKQQSHEHVWEHKVEVERCAVCGITVHALEYDKCVICGEIRNRKELQFCDYYRLVVSKQVHESRHTGPVHHSDYVVICSVCAKKIMSEIEKFSDLDFELRYVDTTIECVSFSDFVSVLQKLKEAGYILSRPKEAHEPDAQGRWKLYIAIYALSPMKETGRVALRVVIPLHQLLKTYVVR